MSAGLSRIDDLLSKMRGVYEADAPPAPPADAPPADKEPEAAPKADFGEAMTRKIKYNLGGKPYTIEYTVNSERSMGMVIRDVVIDSIADGEGQEIPGKDWAKHGFDAKVISAFTEKIVADLNETGSDSEAQDEPEKTEGKLSGDAQDFISKKISKLDKEGYPQKQAVAIAYSMARKAGYDVPEAPKEDDDAPEAEKPKAEVPPMQPRKDEPQSEYMEAFGIPKSALLAAKEELKTYSDFLAKYRDGDVNAFESAAVSENDSELAIRCKSRPPQSWFTEAIRIISQDESVNDPAELATWLWTHWVPKNTRAKLAGQ